MTCHLKLKQTQEIRHCPRCTQDFIVGRPTVVNGSEKEKSQCDCGLKFHHGVRDIRPWRVRMWVPDDQKFKLNPGKYKFPLAKVGAIPPPDEIQVGRFKYIREGAGE